MGIVIVIEMEMGRGGEGVWDLGWVCGGDGDVNGDGDDGGI